MRTVTDHDDPFDDWEDEEEFLAAWERADAEAVSVLGRALAGERPARPSAVEREQAGAGLAEAVRRGTPEGDYVRHALGLPEVPGPVDEDGWLAAVAATISPPEDPQTPAEEQAAVASLVHADWLALVVGLVRRGVGAVADAEEWAADLHRMPDLIDIDEEDPDDESAYESALGVLVPLWQMLGVLDQDDRLTALGRWGLPRALADVWLPAPEPGLPDDQATVVLDLLAEGPTTLADLRRRAAAAGVFTDEETLWRSLAWRLEFYSCNDGVVVHVPVLTHDCVLTHPGHGARARHEAAIGRRPGPVRAGGRRRPSTGRRRGDQDHLPGRRTRAARGRRLGPARTRWLARRPTAGRPAGDATD